MIPFAIFGLAGIIILMFTYAFGLLGFTFPPQFADGINQAINIMHAFSGFLPFISTMVAIWLILIPARIIRYGVDIFRWVWGHVPWIGSSNNKLPKGGIGRGMPNETELPIE